MANSEKHHQKPKGNSNPSTKPGTGKSKPAVNTKNSPATPKSKNSPKDSTSSSKTKPAKKSAAPTGNDKQKPSAPQNPTRHADKPVSLQFKGNKQRKLSPTQNKFNRLVKQIEKLQHNIDDQVRTLDLMQKYYLEEIIPFLPKEVEAKILYMKALFPYYKRKRKELSQDEHNTLGDIIEFIYETTVENQVENDPELQDIHKKIYDESFEATKEEDLEMLKMQTIEFLRFTGVNVAQDRFDQARSIEEMEMEVIKLMQEFQQQAQAGSQSKGDHWDPFANADPFENDPENTEGTFGKRKKKTAAQIKREEKEKEKESLKQKSISTIYKQLAKLFHPDLEPNQDKKIEKEALMQRLTRAYQEKDLHTLLQLELGWIQKEEQNIQQLAEDKLALYCEILQEQTRELKMQAGNLKWHPQYAQMLEFGDLWELTLPNLKASFRSLKEEVHRMNRDTKNLQKKGAPSIKLLRTIINLYAIESGGFLNDDDFLDSEDFYEYYADDVDDAEGPIEDMDLEDLFK